MTRVLLIEPYLTGSHRAWAEGYRAHSAHDIDILGLPGRFWKWRMHGAAVTLARQLREGAARPDVVVATDMLDLAGFLGLARDALAGVPVAAYFHEHQLAYPRPPMDPAWPASRRRRAARPDDAHYPFINLTTALAADVVLWSSDYNRRSFLDRLPVFLAGFPDHREPRAGAEVAARSEILPLGIDLSGLGAPPASAEAWRAQRPPGPPRIVWNHRWEHDKAPERFFDGLRQLDAAGLAFEVIVLGEAFVRAPAAFEAARRDLDGRFLRFGYADSRADYARWLHLADIVVSTARHEFFGVAVCEAIACGCWPLLPARLAYPEIVPAALHATVLYAEHESLADRLARLIAQVASAAGTAAAAPIDGAAGTLDAATGGEPFLPAADFHAGLAALRRAVMAFDWSAMAPAYDARFAEIAHRGRVLDRAIVRL